MKTYRLTIINLRSNLAVSPRAHTVTFSVALPPTRPRLKEQTSVGISFVAGGISGMVAATLTLPFDVVKTQRQMSLGAVEAVRVKPPRVDSTWLLLRRIQAEYGTRGLFAGFLPRIIKAAPSCAIMISTYEFGKSFFHRLNQEQPLGH